MASVRVSGYRRRSGRVRGYLRSGRRRSVYRTMRGGVYGAARAVARSYRLPAEDDPIWLSEHERGVRVRRYPAHVELDLQVSRRRNRRPGKLRA